MADAEHQLDRHRPRDVCSRARRSSRPRRGSIWPSTGRTPSRWTRLAPGPPERARRADHAVRGAGRRQPGLRRSPDQRAMVQRNTSEQHGERRVLQLPAVAAGIAQRERQPRRRHRALPDVVGGSAPRQLHAHGLLGNPSSTRYQPDKFSGARSSRPAWRGRDARRAALRQAAGLSAYSFRGQSALPIPSTAGGLAGLLSGLTGALLTPITNLLNGGDLDLNIRLYGRDANSFKECTAPAPTPSDPASGC